MWHCLCGYHIRGDKVYGLGKLVPHGRIFILRFFFSRIFSAVCVPMERVSHLGNKLSLFSGITRKQKDCSEKCRSFTGLCGNFVGIAPEQRRL